MEFLTDDPVAQAVTYQRVTFDARAPRCGRYGCATAGRVSWTSWSGWLACGCGSATRTGTAARSPGRARTASRSTRSPQRLPDERGHGDRLRDERGVRAVNAVSRGAHPLRHEPLRVRRDRVVVLGDQVPGRLALPARRGGVLVERRDR